jgi:hypothetical protein
MQVALDPLAELFAKHGCRCTTLNHLLATDMALCQHLEEPTLTSLIAGITK